MTVNLNYLESKKLSKDSSLIQQGASSNSLFLLRKGKLAIERNGEILTTVDESKFPLGGPGLLTGLERPASVHAARNSVILKVELDTKDAFDWYVNRPEILFKELRNLTLLINELNKENLKLLDDYENINTYSDEFLEPLARLDKNLDTINLPKLLKKLTESRNKILTRTEKKDFGTLGKSEFPEKFTEKIEEGTKICEEDEESQTMYVLSEGDLTVKKNEQLVARLNQPGTLFGEMAALRDGIRKATVQAETEAEVVKLPVESIKTIFEKSPKLGSGVTRILLNRYEHTFKFNKNLRNFCAGISKIYSNEEYLEELSGEIKELLSEHQHDNNSELADAIDQLEEWTDDPSIPPDDKLNFD